MKETITAKQIRVGGLTLNGRVIMPPVATKKCDEEGYVTEEICEYYGKRALNPNVSMIITEHSFITLQGKANPRQMSIADDRCVDGLRALTKEIHAAGIPAFAQINHAGAAALTEATGMPSVSASGMVLPVEPPMGDAVPQQLTTEQIRVITDEFAAAAARAKAGGYDGVEIHSAHAYLLNQFYSPLTNKREDEYGGCLENRLRFHREVIRAVREAVGSGYPVAVRLGGSDYMPGGNGIEEAAEAARILEAEGIDLLDVSGGMCRYTREGHTEAGYFQDSCRAVREAVSIPVILTGGVKTLSEAETLLAGGAADLIGVGRELMKDPSWSLESEDAK